MRHAPAVQQPGPVLLKRQRFRPVPLLLAAGALAVAAQNSLARGAAAEGAVWYLAAGLAFLRALALSVPAPFPALRAAPLVGLSRVRVAAVVTGLAVAGLAGWQLGAADALSPALSVITAGFVLALVGADAPPRRNGHEFGSAEEKPPSAPALAAEGRPAQTDRVRSSAGWWAALTAITALGLALRVLWLDTLPFGIWYDEAIIGLEAARTASDPDFRPLYSHGTSSPAAFIYLVAGAIRLFGQDAFALRLVSALAGAATVPAFALLLRELAPARLALIGAFLLAVCRWDITFSRLAMQGVTTPLLACLTLWLLVSGLRRGSAVRIIGAGIAAGTGLLLYTAFLAFPLVIAAAIAYAAREDAGTRLRTLAPSLVLFGASALAAAMPFVSFAAHHRDELLARPAAASLLSTTALPDVPRVLLDSLGKHVGMFQFRGDANGRHNLPLHPMLDPLTGAAAALGLAVALGQPLAPLHGLALVWLAAGLLPGVLSLPFEAPQGLRAIGAIPPVLILAALALDHGWRLADNALGPRRQRVALAGSAAGLVLCAGANIYVYFIAQARDYDAWAAHSTAETIIARDLRRLPPEQYDVQVSALYWRHPSIAYLAPGGRLLEPFDLAAGLPLLTRKAAVVLYLEPRDHAAVAHLQRLYPEAQCRRVTVSPERRETLMEVCTVTSADIQATRGLDVRYVETVGGSAAAGNAERLGLLWGGGLPLPAPFQASWTATLQVPQSGVYGFRASGGAVQLRLNETLVLPETLEAAAHIDLAKGLHALSATATVSLSAGEVVVEWQRPGGPWEPIPAEVLLRPSLPPVGLTGLYFPNETWSGPPALRRVDWGIGYYWHLTPLPRPYTIEWTGTLKAPVTGRYRLGLRARSAATLLVNGREVLTVGPTSGEQYVDLDLAAGLHPVRVRYLDAEGYSFIYLSWIPPGGVPETIPAWALRPW